MKLRQLSEAGMGATEYRPPQSATQLMADFYLLQLLDIRPSGHESHRTEQLAYELAQVKQTLVPYLRQHLLDKAGYSICCELRHLFDAAVPNIADNERKYEARWRTQFTRRELEQLGVDEHTVELLRSASVTGRPAPDQFTPQDHLACARAGLTLFRSSYEERPATTDEVSARDSDALFEWEGGFGGAAWVQACKSWLTLYRASSLADSTVYIDKLYSTEHNNGSLLDKNPEYKGGWVKTLLDLKFKANDPEPLIRFASPYLRKLGLLALRANYGRSWDQKQWGAMRSDQLEPARLVRMRLALVQAGEASGASPVTANEDASAFSLVVRTVRVVTVKLGLDEIVLAVPEHNDRGQTMRYNTERYDPADSDVLQQLLQRVRFLVGEVRRKFA